MRLIDLHFSFIRRARRALEEQVQTTAEKETHEPGVGVKPAEEGGARGIGADGVQEAGHADAGADDETRQRAHVEIKKILKKP